MSDLNFQEILSRKLESMGSGMSGTTRNSNDVEPINYFYNKHGYRCDEIKDQKILTLGCSQTVGLGLPLKKTWPFLLSEKMQSSYINLAKSGDSMQGQIIKAFQFFKEFYNPEYIFGIFPITRLEMPYIKGMIATSTNLTNSNKDNNSIQGVFLKNYKIKKFAQQPYDLDEILTEEVAIFYNFMFMQILEQYCKTNNIKLIWTHYNDSSYDKIIGDYQMNTYFKENFLGSGQIDGCHLDYSEDKYFNTAVDKFGKYSKPHWGLHEQIHVAEAMYSMI